MRKLLFLLAAAAFGGALATNDNAIAGQAARAYLCWTAMGGYTDCARLPSGLPRSGREAPQLQQCAQLLGSLRVHGTYCSALQRFLKSEKQCFRT